MKDRKIFIVLLITVALIGFYSVGTVQALDFADWSGIWFKVKVSETGKAGQVITILDPNGDKPVTNNEKTSDAYLKIIRYESIGDPPFFWVGYCTFDGSVWKTQPDISEPLSLTWPIVGGEPEKFLTLFNFERKQSQNIAEEYWIPLEVEGKEASNTVGEIKSASFKNMGGIFLEQIGTPDVTQRGIGSVKFTGSLIKGTSQEVIDKVPEGCRITAPN